MDRASGYDRFGTMWQAILGERLDPKNALAVVAELLCSEGAFLLVRDRTPPNIWRVPAGGAWGPNLPDLPKIFLHDNCDFLVGVARRRFVVLDEATRDVIPTQLKNVGVVSILATRFGVSGVQHAVLAVCNCGVLKDAGKGFTVHYALPDAYLAVVLSRVLALDDWSAEFMV